MSLTTGCCASFHFFAAFDLVLGEQRLDPVADVLGQARMCDVELELRRSRQHRLLLARPLRRAKPESTELSLEGPALEHLRPRGRR
jgi:hypothetical protein